MLLSDHHKMIGHCLPPMTFLLSPVMRRHSAGVYTGLGLAVLALLLAWHCQRLPARFLLYYLAPVLVWPAVGRCSAVVGPLLHTFSVPLALLSLSFSFA